MLINDAERARLFVSDAIMASTSAIISRDQYDEMFGSSGSESEDENSDIDISVSEESDSAEVSESELEDNAESADEDNPSWTVELTNIEVDDFVSPTGIAVELPQNATELDSFKLLFGDDIVDDIVVETNRYALQKLSGNLQRLAKWTAVTANELRAYFGVCIFMGINHLPCTADYWSPDEFTGNVGIQKVMTKNRYEEIGRFFHLNNSELQPKQGEDGYDRLYKVRPILTNFNDKVKEVYHPKKNISVDEGMIAFKGRLAFRQYMPAKPVKYGIKVWMAADSSNGFVVNHHVYLGKENDRVRENGLGYEVVMDLISPFYNQNYHVYFDNFFASPKLMEDLLNEGTYACSTVRIDRKGLPPCSRTKLKRAGETLHSQKGNLLFTKWHDKRDVNILSTNVDPFTPPVLKQRRKKHGEVEEVEKPYCAEQYNKHMGGVDRSDQLRSYYSTCRSFHKWYKYLFWYIFDVSLCNAFILHKENVAVGRPGRRSLVEFRRALARQLIAGYSSRSDNRKRSQRAASLALVNSPDNAHGHFVSRREGKARKRHCVQCKKEEKKTAGGRAKETVYECTHCGVALCKDPCFLLYHSQL